MHIWLRMARWTEDFTFDLEPGLMLLMVSVRCHECFITCWEVTNSFLNILNRG